MSDPGSRRKPCFRHPGRKGRKRCFRCHRPVCGECGIPSSGQLWCSSWCETRTGLEASGRRLLAAIHFPPPAVPFAAAAFFVTAVSLALFVSGSVAELIGAVDPVAEAWSRAAIASPAGRGGAWITAIELQKPGLVSVRGRAGDGARVFLFRGEELVAARIAVGGAFRFDSIAAPEVEAVEFQVATTLAGPPAPGGRFRWEPRPVGSAPPDVSRGTPSRKEIVFSLDAGSHADGAAEILDVLRSRGIRTTIFLTGEFIAKHPDLVLRAVADGHEFGNHSWSHPHLTTFAENGRHNTRPGVAREWFAGELERTAEEFLRVTGRPMARYWRAPFGEQNREIRGWAAALGWTHVGWTRGPDYGMDALDWVSDPAAKNYFRPDEIVRRLLEFDDRSPDGAGGAIILSHLGTDRTEARFESELPALLDGYAAKGYRFVRVSELLTPESRRTSRRLAAPASPGSAANDRLE